YRTDHSIKAANDQLAHFCTLLEGEGVVVRRPDIMDFNLPVKTPDFEVPRMNTSACPRDTILVLGNEGGFEVPRMNTSACPRDTILVLGNEVIEATMSWRSRFFEYRGTLT
ncbi:hypothetical protein T484DRAFT_1857532, partial [Baffinella frigidus]